MERCFLFSMINSVRNALLDFHKLSTLRVTKLIVNYTKFHNQDTTYAVNTAEVARNNKYRYIRV